MHDLKTPGASINSDYLFFLDGLRAIAIIAVLLFHSDNAWLQGGFLGVDIFFVISGFIISKLLLDEWNKTGRLDLKGFWLRRFRRLVPAAFTMMLMTWIYVVVFVPNEIDQIFEDLPYGLSFTNNWNYIINDRSYFELIGRPRLFEHLWSLGVEFQFYIMWALSCFVLFRSKRWLACALILFTAIYSSYLMAILYDPNEDPSRIYFGTDTRASALLIGALLAFIIRQVVIPLGKIKCHLFDLLAFFGLVGLVLCCVYAKSTEAWLFQGGFFCVSLLTAMLIAACFLMAKQNHFSLVLMLLSNKIFRICGMRAYGIYLWHWPVFSLTQAFVDVPVDGWQLFILRMTVTVFFSETSYRFIEKPIRNGYFEQVIKYLMRSTETEKKKNVALWILTSCLSMAGCSSLLIATEKQLETSRGPSIIEEVMLPAAVNKTDSSTVIEAKAEAALPPELPGAQFIEEQKINIAAIDNSYVAIGNTALIEKQTPADNNLPSTNICELKSNSVVQKQLQFDYSKTRKNNVNRIRTIENAGEKAPVFLLGDSVMVSAAAELSRRLPCVGIDSQVGRQVAAGIKVIAELKSQNLLSDTVVIHLGNNSPFNSSQMEKLVDLLSDAKRIIFINLKLPRNYEAANNKLLDDLSASHPNVTVIDWRSNSMNSEHVFNKDGIHLTGNGAKLYANLIYKTLAELTLNDDQEKLKKLADTEKMILELKAKIAANNAELAKMAAND